MDLTPNSDQVGLIDAVEKLVAPFTTVPANSSETVLTSADLDAQLREGGFRDAARFEGMGPIDAVLLAEIVHALPYSTEFVGSALLGPALDVEIEGPLALLWSSGNAPVRFLVPGGTALIADGDDVWVLPLTSDNVEVLQTPFAYPLGRLREGADWRAGKRLAGMGEAMCLWWAVALAAEIGATAHAATQLTVGYAKDRRQFGRPIGSYQAVQHRLSECEVAVHAIRALTRRAAALGTQEAVLAALVLAKEACPRILYDTHQFQGAIGLTLEYPLHFFTYRLRLLHGEIESLAASAERLALLRWDTPDIDWNE